MNHKKWTLSAFLLVLGIPFVAAADKGIGQSIADIFEKIFGFLFINFSWNGSSFFYMKTLIFFFMFAVLYWVTSRVLPETSRGVAITIPLTISLIATMVIPNPVIKTIAESYGFFVAFFMLGLPIVGSIFIIRWFDPSPPPQGLGRAAFAIRAALFYLMAFLIHQMINVSAEYKLVTPEFLNFPEFIKFISDILVILFVWYMFRALFYGGGQPVPAAAGAGASSWFRNPFAPAGTPGGPGAPGTPAPYPAHLRTTYLLTLRGLKERLAEVLGYMERAGHVHEGQVTASGGTPIGWTSSAGKPKPPAFIRDQYTSHRDEIINTLMPAFVAMNTNLANDPQFHRMNAADTTLWARTYMEYTHIIRNFNNRRIHFESVIDYT